MSERSDQGAPLFPRRTLTGPPAEEPAPESPERSRPARESASERVRDGGPPTAAMAPPYASPAPTTAPPAPRPAPQPAQQPSGDGDRQPTPQTAERAARKPARPARPGPATSKPRGQAPRKARLRVVRIDPWSVMKMAFALSIALAIVTVIAVAIVWAVLDAAGVWAAINSSVDALRNARTGSDFDVIEYVGFARVMGLAMVVSAANIVLLTALATLGAFLYNLAAALLGGFEVTLAEDR